MRVIRTRKLEVLIFALGAPIKQSPQRGIKIAAKLELALQ